MKNGVWALFVGFIVGFFLTGFVSAVPDLEIKKIDKGSVVIAESDGPAIFDFVITNNGPADDFEIYSLVGVSMGPGGTFTIPHGESTHTIYAYPNAMRRSDPGFLTFKYSMKGERTGTFEDTLTIKIVPLEDALEISPAPLGLEDDTLDITIRNTENTNIENIGLAMTSIFFSYEGSLSLEPFETKVVSVPVSILGAGSPPAGMYLMSVTAQFDNKEIPINSVVEYLEKEKVSTREETEGFFVRKTTIEKKNVGNKPVTATIEVKKDIVSRLFTINSPTAQGTRSGLSVVYYWEQELSPGESLVVESRTNYIFPFAIAILIIIAGLLAKIYSQNAVALHKDVSLVKTKGGEFALKVTLRVKARNFVTSLKVTDTLPHMAKLYEQFGKKPDRIDANMRRLTWNIERLSAGEERIYSYIIYSKLKVVGRFELPAATAVFEKDGKIQEVWSNRAFFATEESKTT